MKTLYLVDYSALIYRMFYAFMNFKTTSGESIGAVFGFCNFIFKVILEENPNYLVFLKDAPGGNFRNEIYSDYKATRQKMPDELKSQMKICSEIIEKMGFYQIEKQNFEADDLIASFVNKFQNEENLQIFILSGDKDLHKLITKNVFIYDQMRKNIVDEKGVLEKFKVEAKFITDYLAIVGDSSDNIPGIPGIGPKKAEILIGEFGNLENIYKNLEDFKAGKNNEIIGNNKEVIKLFDSKIGIALSENKEIAFLSKTLATLKEDLEVLENLEDLNFDVNKIFSKEVFEFVKKYEFKSLFSYFPEFKAQKIDLNKIKLFYIKRKIDIEELFENLGNEVFVHFSKLEDEIYFKKGDLIFVLEKVNGKEFLQIILDKIDENGKTIISYDFKKFLHICDNFLSLENLNISKDENVLSLF